MLAGLDAGQEPDEAQRAELMRALHTIKGNAAMLGLRPLQELVHGVEDAFKLAASPAVLPLDVLHRAAAALHRALEAAGGAEQEQAFAPLAPLRAELADALAAPAPSTQAADEPAAAETRDDASAAVPSASAARDAGAEAPTSTEAAPVPPAIPPRVPIPAATALSPAAAPALPARTPSPGDAPAPERRSEAGAREESLRIPFARLDPLLGQVDDLSRAVEGLRAWAAENAQALQAAGLRRGAAERLEELEASASAVRRGATSLRLVA
ncbi:MAG TPA: Hpt domain-containing protein, partial [Longimicrobium sp.]|nr:Hpt domain-containing protein [Longimicrobium sp.]